MGKNAAPAFNTAHIAIMASRECSEIIATTFSDPMPYLERLRANALDFRLSSSYVDLSHRTQAQFVLDEVPLACRIIQQYYFLLSGDSQYHSIDE